MSEPFLSKLPHGLKATGAVERRLLAEYGAMFVARTVLVPDRIVFRNQTEVSEFQSNAPIKDGLIGGLQMELQAAAMEALLAAVEEARSQGLSLSPRDVDSARRSFDETVSLWASRVEPALDHWVSEGKLDAPEAKRIRSLTPSEQVPVILELEEGGIYFAKDLSKSIIYSVAPPGTSQHLAMLAFDTKEHNDPYVRQILARHYWFQTVISDLPHFTYLGVGEQELPHLGLKHERNRDRTFWVPDMRFD